MDQQSMDQQSMDQQNINQQNINQQNIDQQSINQQNAPYEEELDRDQAKKILSKTGFALFVMTAAVLIVQGVIEYLVGTYNPALVETDWYIWAITAFTVVGVGLPVFHFMSRGIPDSIQGEKVKLKFIHFITIFFICTAAMYITNFFSVFITVLISLAKGENIFDLNPLMEILEGSNFALTLLYASIVAPIVEELIFRKLLLNKLRRFGDVPAILLSGIAFGLFHLNLAQIFYATALGMIFAYVTIRTNTVKYSIILHIMINFIGTAITPLASKQSLIFSIIMVFWVFGAITLGIVLFILNIRKIRLYRALHPIEKKSDYIMNVGTALYTLLCLVIIVMVTVS